MMILQIVCIALISIFMSIVVFAWVTTLNARKEIDKILTGYIVDANNDYIMRFDYIQEREMHAAIDHGIIKDKLDQLTGHKIKTFRDFETGLLNSHALEVYQDRYNDQEILHFSIIKVSGIKVADEKIKDVLNITSYASSRVGSELYKEAYRIDKMCDIYRLDYERFLIISIDSMVLEIMTKVKEDLLKYHEVADVYIGSSRRVTKKKAIDKCISAAESKLNDNIRKTKEALEA